MRGLLAPLIKLIVFAIVTILATTVLALTIASTGARGDSKFSAIFSDASMLNPGDEIRIAGVRVGTVDSVDIYERNRAMVRFNINRDTLPASTQVFIRYRNLTGLRYVALERGDGDPMETVGVGHVFGQSGDDRSTHPAVNLTELFNGFRPIFRNLTPEDINKLTATIIAVFDGGNMDVTMANLLQQTSELTNTIADRDAVIGEMITNLTGVLETINRNDTEFKALLDNTEALVTGLAAQRDTIGSAVTSVSKLTDVTGSILDQTRPSIQGSIAGLKDLSDKINARSGEVSNFLENLPVKLQRIGRAATFGSWFQFYLCGLDIVAGNGKSTLLTQPLVPLPNINHVLYTSAATRCWRDNQRPGGN